MCVRACVRACVKVSADASTHLMPPFASKAVESQWQINHGLMQNLSEQKLVSCESDCDGCGGGWPVEINLLGFTENLLENADGVLRTRPPPSPPSSLGTAACCLLVVLTRAPLMTSSQSKAVQSTGLVCVKPVRHRGLLPVHVRLQRHVGRLCARGAHDSGRQCHRVLGCQPIGSHYRCILGKVRPTFDRC